MSNHNCITEAHIDVSNGAKGNPESIKNKMLEVGYISLP